MNEKHYQVWLKEEEKEVILKYLLDRRYKFMTLLYFSIPLSIVFAMYLAPFIAISKGIDIVYGYFMDGNDQMIYMVLIFAALLGGLIEYLRNRKKTAMISLIIVVIIFGLYLLPIGGTLIVSLLRWIVYLGLSACITLILFFQGYGKKFGKNSDYDCIKNDKYQLDFCQFGGKESNDSGNPPYFVKNIDGDTCECPVFMDWKKAQEHDTLLCITLHNGKKYALLQKVSLEK